MNVKDAVDFSNDFLATHNRLPHPQEIWDAAWGEAEEKFTTTNTERDAVQLLREFLECYDSTGISTELAELYDRVYDFIAELRKLKG